MEYPLKFHFNRGVGFLTGGYDLIMRKTLIMQSEYLKPNTDF
jgi:hypothetical protein